METVKINMVPKGAVKAAHASQGDAPRVVRFELFDELLPYTLDGSEDITLTVVRPDTEEIVSLVTNTEEAYIDVSFTSEMTAIRGVANCEIKISKSGAEIGSHNFDLNIERGAYGEDITVEAASGVIATFTTGVIDNLVGLKTTFEPKQDLHGYDRPWPAGAGKNLINVPNAVVINTGITFDSLVTTVNVVAGVTYTLSCMQENSMESNERNTLIVVIDGSRIYENSTSNYHLSSGIHTLTFTPSVSGECEVRIWGHTLSTQTTYDKFQLEVGSQATTYEPYANICEITGIDDITFNRTGVNLFDGNKVTTTHPSNWSVTFENDNLTIVHKTAYVSGAPIFNLDLPSGNYVISYTATQLYKVSLYINGVYNKLLNNGTTFTIENGNTYAITFTAEDNSTNVISNIQLEKGSQASEYKAYTGEIALVEIGQTVYGGYYDKDLGIVLTDKLVDLGSYTWFKVGMGDGRQGFRATFDDMELTPASNIPINALCSVYPILNGNQVYLGNIGLAGWGADTQAVAIYDPLHESDTINEFKAFVNGIKVCYKLADPIIIPADAVNFETVKGVNNVWSDTNGETEVKFYVKEA